MMDFSLGAAMRGIISVLARSEGGRRLLERSIDSAQRSMGIGSGADVDSSGERIVLDLLRRSSGSVRPLCILDVGSNQGQFLKLLLSELYETPHQIHCFEPSPSTFAILRANATEQSNVVFNMFGLGIASGEFDLFSDSTGSGLASLSKRRLEHFNIEFNHCERIEIRTLDSYCYEKNIGNIDLLKIDVEGHELEVLNGGVRMFSERRIQMLTFEFGGCNIDSRTFFQDFYYFLNSHGMSSIFRIMPSGGLHKITSYNEELEQFRTTNFIALRNGAAG
jgi:FkbM family methyltransferase